jgi:hypothetical protein
VTAGSADPALRSRNGVDIGLDSAAELLCASQDPREPDVPDPNISRQQPVADGEQATAPAMPFVPPEELYRGAPYMLVQFGQRHTIGWQDDRKAGPTFVVIKVGALDTAKVIERFPLTEAGWHQAWQALLSRDPGGAAAAAATLAARADHNRARVQLAQLDADSVACLWEVIFLGGTMAAAELAKGKAYDLRFLADRLLVCPAGWPDPAMTLPYAEVDAIDIGGPGQVKRWSAGQAVGLTLAFGLPGAIAGAASTKIQTIIRIEAAGCEMFFLSGQKVADDLRIELSAPLKAVRDARLAHLPGTDGPPSAPPESIPDQLARLADMVEKGLLTREEFDLLKAKLIAGA